ncbi:hypothetical protein G2W53_030370 [Senna tora]|uniref:Uncharacterized protein n=1 Tax=Senna tora TaxID=362788 RepID=A0A834T7C0_9FABA|nr:hypothetical protein G2W53_030370 [Senna tora]
MVPELRLVRPAREETNTMLPFPDSLRREYASWHRCLSSRSKSSIAPGLSPSTISAEWKARSLSFEHGFSNTGNELELETQVLDLNSLLQKVQVYLLQDVTSASAFSSSISSAHEIPPLISLSAQAKRDPCYYSAVCLL